MARNTGRGSRASELASTPMARAVGMDPWIVKGSGTTGRFQEAKSQGGNFGRTRRKCHWWRLPWKR